MRLDPSTLGEPDVVLVEASVKRRYETEKVSANYSRTVKDRWYVDYDIVAVVLLHDAPKREPTSGFVKELVDFEM